jgi:hypothetical protein
MIDEWKGFGCCKKRSTVVIDTPLKMGENYPHMMITNCFPHTTIFSTIENLPQWSQHGCDDYGYQSQVPD